MAAPLPIRAKMLAKTAFEQWLAANGAEVGEPTNPYEVVRYRAFAPGASRAATHIIYAKESGLLTYTGESRRHYEAFLAGADILGEIPA